MSNNVIIIPALNPDYQLIGLVRELKKKFNYIIVIDDGSKSSCSDIFNIVQKEGVILVKHSNNLGKGEGIKSGVREALKLKNITGFITVDCDGQHILDDILKISLELDSNKDSLILGIRNMKGKNVPLRSKIFSFISYLYFLSETNKKCPDTYTGLRGIPIKYKDIIFKVEGSRFEYEMNFLLYVVNKGINVKYVSVNTIYINNNRDSNYRTIRDTVRMYRKIITFVASSISSSLVDLVGFVLLKYLGLSIIISTFVARIFSGIMNFGLNKHFAFKLDNNNNTSKQLFLFALLFIVKMVLSALIVDVISFINVPLIILKVIVDILLFYVGYVIQNKYIFVE